MFDMDTMQQFEITALNPDLVQSHAQVYGLRAIARQFFCAERVQSLTVQNHVEKARCITALVDVLIRAGSLHKVLIVSRFSHVLDQISLCFRLHTQLKTVVLSGTTHAEGQVSFSTYQHFFEVYGWDNLDEIFARFDLIVVDEPDDEANQVFIKKLALYLQWILYIYMPKPKMLF
ncbi:hypothetical protein [Acinetobacter populi]|uniref:Uncharacterized protein n=1 Tax=Acinetobacter populi TaxID=1582270 RepID=A0A1Z9YY25_9GAMM|nr:hypothetical protein [Acinetobacter populi]OUY07109.1 hypothetical protein CAP51_10500 [Acinetobacter populi]